ncbi:hypothetical protein [Sphingomonas solaris]|uniref:Nuclear transport factor 2 family protein n=1 Tax=Alterirhizorhabdus solaris TaxID=2529389 RepID=A0A558R4B2_9SPHN|nr:hypothetical protein [Sphingomonas solaris]TVV74172.1 hypothetical protein FOY91_10605 [Sphingomonas solaris]
MQRFFVTFAVLVSTPTMAWADSTTQISRIERHREMAEKRIREHQAMTQAHIEGRSPICPAADVLGTNPTFFSPAFGESPIKPSADGADHVSLNELRMYWKRIGDFGIKKYQIYPANDGWAQVLYWAGTTSDGKLVEAQEADIFRTDKEFRIVRVENYHDWQQWKSLAAFVNGKDPKTFDGSAYGAAIEAQAKSATEVCRPR